MSERIDLNDFVAGFLLESEEHLHLVNKNLVSTSEALKKNLSEPRAVRDLFRSLHTIKGLAAMVGAEPIVDISHEMESILRTADRAGGKISEANLDLLMQGTRAIEERVREVSQVGVQNITKASAKLIESLALVQTTIETKRENPELASTLPESISKALTPAERECLNQASARGERLVLIEFRPSPENASAGFNITSVRESLAKIAELIKVSPKSVPSAPTGIAFSLLIATQVANEMLAHATANSEMQEVQLNSSSVKEKTPLETAPATAEFFAEESPPEWLPSEQSSIRVDVRRLDEALEQLSGLFVTKFKLDRVAAEMSKNAIDTRELRSVIGETSRQLKRLRSAISEARMVALSELLQRLPLVVRGITKDSDKTVNLKILAGSAEVDKAVADKIFPALVHLVRNAVDHALEPRSERTRMGKPEAGEITIHCDDSSGTNLIVTISDDGRGVNREAVAQKAGLPTAKTDAELLDQICSAGLSTSQAVTHTSGRGMGMDIVRRAIEVLGGTLSLKTSVGKGSSFILQVPVTITIVDVFSFISGVQTFVTPVAVVDEIIEVPHQGAILLPSTGTKNIQTRLIQHRGKTIPFYVLDSVLESNPLSAVPAKAFILHRPQGTVAFGIDRVLGKQEAVVRALDDILVRVIGVTGATDLGDGRPTLVLDLGILSTSLFQRAKSAEVSL